MRIPRTLPDTLAQVPTYGAITHPRTSLGKPDPRIQIVRTSPRRVVLLRAYREAGKHWEGVRLSFEDWYQKVVEFQREGGHAVR